MLHLLLCTFLFFQHTLALDTTIDLGYARYQGTNIGNGVIRWAGMRYARNPSRVTGLRFAPPQNPINESGVSDATKFGPLCIGTSSTITAEFGGPQSEDCLFINVFAPQGATNSSKLPVYVFIQGGGFNANSNANYNGTGLIDAADNDMVVVNFNYRVGPYGFLAGSEITANKSLSLNNGLKDQRQALVWVQKHIAAFGGDPNHVTLGGASAGGGSVVFQLTAYGGRNDNLFQAVAAESAAFPPLRTVDESQWQYDALQKATGCGDINCMVSMDAVKFQTAVKGLNEPLPGAKQPPIFFWSPALDKDFVADYTDNEIDAGHFVNVPAIFGDDTNEGLEFTPTSITTEALAEQFVLDQFTAANWDAIMKVWAAPPNNQWRQLASDVYGHIRYICPNLNIATAFSAKNPTWQYRWNVGSALHVAEVMPIWNNGTSASDVFIHSYWASFIRSYDPNKYPTQFFAGKGQMLTSPTWQHYNGSDAERILFNDQNVVQVETVTSDEQKKCQVINNMGITMKQTNSGSGSSSGSGSNSTSVASSSKSPVPSKIASSGTLVTPPNFTPLALAILFVGFLPGLSL